MHKLNELVKYVAKDKVLFLQPSDKNRENNRLLKESLENDEDSEQVQTTISLLTVTNDSVHPTFSIKPGCRLNYYLLLSNPILFGHYDYKHHIPSKTKFRLGMIQ